MHGSWLSGSSPRSRDGISVRLFLRPGGNVGERSYASVWRAHATGASHFQAAAA